MRSPQEFAKFIDQFFPEEFSDIKNPKTLKNRGRHSNSGKDPTKKNFAAGNSMPIPHSNLGHQLLLRMGWQGGGLGSQQQGIEEPIQPSFLPIRKGLGW